MNLNKINKTYLAVLCCIFSVCTYAQTEPEIVIEMHGEPVKQYRRTNLSVWDKNTPQLLKALRGKTRQQALYDIEQVSSKDRTVKASNTSYRVVEYIQGDDFRKFLFADPEPQTFITAATTPADILAINKKYGINMGLSQRAFEQAYAGQYAAEKTANLPPHTVLYTLSYTDVNTPKAQPVWFLFKLKQLSQTFYTEAEKDAYLHSLIPSAPAKAEQPAAKPTPKKTVRKALVSGGTVWDRMYMPRLITDESKEKNSSQNTNN